MPLPQDLSFFFCSLERQQLKQGRQADTGLLLSLLLKLEHSLEGRTQLRTDVTAQGKASHHGAMSPSMGLTWGSFLALTHLHNTQSQQACSRQRGGFAGGCRSESTLDLFCPLMCPPWVVVKQTRLEGTLCANPGPPNLDCMSSPPNSPLSMPRNRESHGGF